MDLRGELRSPRNLYSNNNYASTLGKKKKLRLIVRDSVSCENNYAGEVLTWPEMSQNLDGSLKTLLKTFDCSFCLSFHNFFFFFFRHWLPVWQEYGNIIMFTSAAVTARGESSGRRLVLDGKIEICLSRFIFFLNSQASPLVQIPLCGFTCKCIC